MAAQRRWSVFERAEPSAHVAGKESAFQLAACARKGQSNHRRRHYVTDSRRTRISPGPHLAPLPKECGEKEKKERKEKKGLKKVWRRSCGGRHTCLSTRLDGGCWWCAPRGRRCVPAVLIVSPERWRFDSSICGRRCGQDDLLLFGEDVVLADASFRSLGLRWEEQTL